MEDDGKKYSVGFLQLLGDKSLMLLSAEAQTFYHLHIIVLMLSGENRRIMI